MKKLICLILALTMLAAVLAGCGTKEETSEPETAAPEVESSSAAKEPAAEENAAGPASIEYPIADGDQVLTLWTDFQEEDYLKSQNDFPIMPAMREATGIDFQFIEVSKSAASEQFNLMIASGEWPDMFNPVERYSGGAEQAYEDEVIINMTDLLEANAPDYWGYVEQLSENDYTSLLTTTNEGEDIMLYMSSINDCTYTSRGNVCRGDWLDELGYTTEDMRSLEGLTEVLYAVYNTYEPDYTLHITSSALVKNLYAFEAAIPDLSSSSNLSIYLNDGAVESGWTSGEYRDYLEWLIGLYKDGIVYEDFHTIDWAMNETLAHIANGGVFMYETGNDVVDDVKLYADEENADIYMEPMYGIFDEDTTANEFGSETSLLGFAKMAVTTTCEIPELAIQYMNFFFTEKGIMMANYGTEGESYVLNENGEPEFTDLILNNPVITNVQGANKNYAAAYLIWYNHQMKLFSTFGGTSAHCVEVWSSEEFSTESTYPGTLGLTTEESDSIINKLTDCCACAQERILKFITGSMELNDDTWAEYVADMEQLGIRECLDVYQNAYEEYLAGERKAGGGMPMGGGPMGGPMGGPAGGAEGEDGERPEPPPM